MRGNRVPTVDPDDFKKCWRLRRSLPGGSVDVEVYRKLCKPETDAFAAGFRASALFALLPLIPSDELVNGEPSDVLLEEFARMPLEEGEPVSLPKIKSKGPPKP
jgi:hypothetical protein